MRSVSHGLLRCSSELSNRNGRCCCIRCVSWIYRLSRRCRWPKLVPGCVAVFKLAGLLMNSENYVEKHWLSAGVEGKKVKYSDIEIIKNYL